MLKKIDKLVLKAYIPSFLLTFCVAVFILLTQYMLSYLEDFVGKNLGPAVYCELLFYFSINMMPLALPLAILLSSLIAYGNLGEHFELTAIKSSGISLLRTLLPIFVFVLLLTVGSFYFSDIIVPKANLKAYSLLYDIRQKKPSIDLKEGAFYNGIPGYSIKVGEKGVDGKSLKNLIIYDHTPGNGNTRVTIADSGRMQMIMNESYLELLLYNGSSFNEIIENNIDNQTYIRTKFKNSRVMFSMESFKFNKTKEELFSTNKVMRTSAQLVHDIDSLNKELEIIRSSVKPNISGLFMYYGKTKKEWFVGDSAKIHNLIALKSTQVISKERKNIILQSATNNARSIKSYVQSYKERIEFLDREIRGFEIEYWRKFSQAIACIILFLIGAPIGSIIKKGGLGVPILISVIFFMAFHMLSLVGQQWAKEGAVDVILGMWIADLVLLPIGLFLLRQAKNDSRILDTDFLSVKVDQLKDYIIKMKTKSI